MTRRSSKVEGTLLGMLLVIGLPLYLVNKAVDSVGWSVLIGAVIALVVITLWLKYNKKQRRLAYLRDKYQDEGIVQNIYVGYFWQGQTAEQLKDSLGPPAAVDNKLLKTKTREVWKYQPTGRNRYALRVTVEDGYVTGWDKKA